MLKESIEVFKKELDIYGDKIILDGYIPTDGTYIIITETDNGFEEKDIINVKYDKKTNTVNVSELQLNKIRALDYNSKLIDMNKPIDSKKIIHSNNYLSFFIKKDKFPTEKDTEKKLNLDVINGYYNILADPYLKYKQGKQKEVYVEIENEIGTVNIELLNKIKTWITENIFDLGKRYPGKDYLKIFFDYSIDEYIKENKRYIIPNIYNKNDYNEKINDVVYGLPNDNMGLNSKKPYLENKTRKIKVPYFIDINEVLLQKKFFDYLMNFASEGKLNIFIDKDIKANENGKLPRDDFNGSFIRIKKGKELEIQNYDKIVGYKEFLSKEFNFENVLKLNISKDKDEISYGIYRNKTDIQKIINEVLFSNCLINNYFTDSKDISIKDNTLKKNLLVARESIFKWIYMNDSNRVGELLDKVTLSVLKGTLENGYIPKAGRQFNLRCAIKEYFEGGNKMADLIKDMKNSLIEKINLKETSSINDDKESDLRTVIIKIIE